MKLDIAKRGCTLTFDKSYLIRKGAKTKLTFTCKTDPNWRFFTYTKFEIGNTERIKKAARTALTQRLEREYEKTEAYKEMRKSVCGDARKRDLPYMVYERKTHEYINSILPNYECDAEPVKQELEK